MDVATAHSDALLLQHLDAASIPPMLRDDLRQDTAVRILTRLRSDEPPALSKAYVRRATRTAAIDRARRQSRRQALLDTNASALQWAGTPQDPERRVHARHVGRIIAEELAGLAEPRREVVLLFLSGHGVSAIAERLGLDRKRVDNWVYRSLSTLRRRLMARGLTPDSVLGH